MNDVVKLPEAPALGISVRGVLEGAEIVFQTHVDSNTSRADLDKITDTLLAVIKRQRAKDTLIELEKNREVNASQLTDMLANRDSIDARMRAEHADSGRRGDFKLNQQQAQARKQSEDMEHKLREVLKRFDKQIEETKAVIAGTAE